MKDNTAQERALKELLLAFQDAVVAADAGKIEDLIHEKAAIMVGRDRQILSKAAYAAVLPGRLAENSDIFLGTPRMAVSGDGADIRVYMRRGGDKFLMTFTMRRENGRWYISG